MKLVKQQIVVGELEPPGTATYVDCMAATVPDFQTGFRTPARLWRHTMRHYNDYTYIKIKTKAS